MKRILLAFAWMLISLPMVAQLKLVPLVPESFARTHSGPVTISEEGLRLATVGRRNSNTLMLKDGFNAVGQDVYIKWFLKSDPTIYNYIRGAFVLVNTNVNSEQLNTYPRNEWLYTRIRVNEDYTFSVITTRGNYDDQGGTVVKSVIGEVEEGQKPALSSTSLKIEIADTYDALAYMDIAEMLVPADEVLQYRETELWDFEEAIPLGFIFEGSGSFELSNTDVFDGASALKILGNDGDLLQIEVPADYDLMTFRLKISHSSTKAVQLKVNDLFINHLGIYYNGSTSYLPEWCEVAVPMPDDGLPTIVSLSFLSYASQLILMDDVRFYSKDVPKSQLNLENGDIQEKSPVGTHVGDFFGTESEGRDLSILTHGLQSPDKDFFTLNGSALKTAEVLISADHNSFSLDVVAEVSGVLPLLYRSFDINVLPEFAGGDGSFLSPYQIANPRHLNNVRNYLGAANKDVHFELVNDIDLTEVLSPTGPYYNDGALWEPIGMGAERFESKLEGNGFAIRGLAINRPTENTLGLFFAIGNDGAIQNLKIFTDDVVGIVGQDYMGVLAGFADMSYMDIYIKNVEVNGKVTGRNYVGGVFGLINMGRNIEYLSAHVNVTGVDFVGGLIGYSGIPLSRCLTTGSVQGENYVGGLVGRNRLDEEFWMEDGRIIDSYSRCSVSGNSGVGGLVGLNEGAVVRSYASGAISGMTDVGGLFGSGSDVYVSDSYWNTETTGVSVSLGGIGISSGQMRDRTTFTGWDFENVWTSLSGENRSFPYFKMVTTDPIPGKIGVPSITTLPNATLVYGQAIGSSVMTGALVEHEGLEVEGSFVLSPTELKPLAGTETVDFVFEPLLPELYLPISGQMDVEVSQAPLTATADNQSRTYGAANPALSISYSGFVNGEDATAITAPEAATLAEATSPVGDYAITLSGGAADNYELTLESGTLSVSQAPLTVTALDQTRTVGDENPLFELDYSGFVIGDDPSALTQLPMASTVADINSIPGEYSIEVGGGDDTNYYFIYQSGTLYVTISVGSAEALEERTVSAYPNPFISEITFSGFGPATLRQADLFDLSGRKLRTFMVSDGTSVDLSDLPAGVYLIKVDNQLFKMVKK